MELKSINIEFIIENFILNKNFFFLTIFPSLESSFLILVSLGTSKNMVLMLDNNHIANNSTIFYFIVVTHK